MVILTEKRNRFERQFGKTAKLGDQGVRKKSKVKMTPGYLN